MSILCHFLLFCISFLYSLNLFSQTCLFGNKNNTHLIEQLKTASESGLSLAITSKYGLNLKSEDECVDCDRIKGLLDQNNKANLNTILNAAKSNKFILNPSCLKASTKVKTGAPELKCPQNSKSSKHQFCVTENLVQYQNAVLTDFYKCIKATQPDFPVSPAGLFEMYTVESGFKPQFSSSGGVGLGQLTSVFVQDVNQEGRGRFFLKEIAKSKKSECQIAKDLAARDLNKPHFLKNNHCDFIQYGEGLERNILYSLIGIATLWKNNFSKKLKAYSDKYPGDPQTSRIKELVTLNSYGRGGTVAAQATFNSLKHLKPASFLNLLSKPLMGTRSKNLNPYIVELVEGKSSLAGHLPPQLKNEFQKKRAQACVQ